MHNSRYYRNPAIYAGNERTPRFPVSHIRSTYQTTSTTPFSPAQVKGANPRFVDRSKYVWTANKQQSQSVETNVPKTSVNPTPSVPVVPSLPPSVASKSPPVPSKPPLVKSLPMKNPGSRNLNVLTVTALDPPVAVTKDIAFNLHEKKVYLIRKVVDVLGVKKAIKLYYDTRLRENSGGILIQNGKRRRTPGGVFLTLLREVSYITKEEAEQVFHEIKKYESQMHYYDGYR